MSLKTGSFLFNVGFSNFTMDNNINAYFIANTLFISCILNTFTNQG